MFHLNMPKKSIPTALLWIAFLLCLHGQVNAAKITTATNAANTSASNTNSSSGESIITTEKSKVPATIIVMPTIIAADAITEAKAVNGGDTVADVEPKEDNESAVETDEAEEDDDADDDDEAESVTALTPVEKDDDTTSAFSIWGIVRGVWNWIKDDLSESFLGADNAEGASATTKALVRQVRDVTDATRTAVESRTFGKIRRLQMALVPLIFKFGILTAMVAFLIMLGMKTLFLVKLLVLMNAAAIFAKLITLKSNLGGHEHSVPSWNYQTWTPPLGGGWAPSAPAPSYSHSHEHQPTKEIHLHIHGGQVHGYDSAGSHGVVNGGHGWASRSDSYAGYAPSRGNEADNELENQGPVAMMPTRYTPH